ncbi:MAG: nicotinate phosphoribosyltransferase [Clostridiales bacterium]|jgi:nicotinate phosphoribosyltransferase|nr:nicotinate phosphoribosyltransferase [Clostridiales bacterium]
MNLLNNTALLTDLYELTMMQGYHKAGLKEKKAVFDLYFRDNPCGNGYSVCAGLAQVLEYIENLRFTADDIDYLRGLNLFEPEFLDYLKGFRFTGDIWAVPEGNMVFPLEPIVRVSGRIMEAQLIESALLNIVNHQTLIATKAARIVQAAAGDPVMEFGLRRAQGPDASVLGARAAVIGGCVGTSNTLCGKLFGVPVMGTHAHSWIMSFPDELTAFRAYVMAFPDNPLLLVDTYDTLKSGVPNAITVYNEMIAGGRSPKSMGIRLDSGDLAFMSKNARRMLDEAGLEQVKICASNDLDEELIMSLKHQDAAITVWGVGTNLITSKGCPALGGVYKMAAELEDGVWRPRIKLSDNPEKVTTPGVKKIYRLIDREQAKLKADLITLEHESVDEKSGLTLFDPVNPWRRMTLEAGSFEARELLVPVVVNGERVYDSPGVMDIRAFCQSQKDLLWDEHRRLVNPHVMPVDLSDELFNLKKKMIYESRR